MDYGSAAMILLIILPAMVLLAGDGRRIAMLKAGRTTGFALLGTFYPRAATTALPEGSSTVRDIVVV